MKQRILIDSHGRRFRVNTEYQSIELEIWTTGTMLRCFGYIEDLFTTEGITCGCDPGFHARIFDLILFPTEESINDLYK